MGNSQSYCQQAEEQNNEEETRIANAAEELFSRESATNDHTESFVPDSVTARTNDDSQQDLKEEGEDVLVVSAEDVPEAETVVEEEEEEEIEENEEDEDEKDKKTIILHTAPIDPRFSGTNASRYCFVVYNEYYKCINERGEDDFECKAKGRTYRSICPSEWLAQWNELREEGKWFGKY
jgi:cytochrome c oxidase subunit 6b